jgi:hypothetical protein
MAPLIERDHAMAGCEERLALPCEVRASAVEAVQEQHGAAFAFVVVDEANPIGGDHRQISAGHEHPLG